ARVALVALFAIACTRGGDGNAAQSGAPGSSAAIPLAASAGKSATGSSSAVVIDYLSDRGCTFGHRGALLDLGDPAMLARMSRNKVAPADIEMREHEGATWAAIHTKSLELSFVSPSEIKSDAGIVVQARVRGGVAKSASAYLDGKPLGTLPFAKGET